MASLSREKADLYGLPHIGARYTGRHGAKRYERLQEWCFVCGRPSTCCHHLVPLSNGASYLKKTPLGTFELRSPLFCLCGSGTTGCHDGFHGGAWLKAWWKWDEPGNAEKWDTGLLLCEYGPNSDWLYDYGCWLIQDRKNGRITAYRERNSR